jgi:hypothetical protein
MSFASLAIQEDFAAAGPADGRLPVAALYRAFQALHEDGWLASSLAVSARQREGRNIALPIPALSTPKAGPAVWIIAGIHGEEPAGPNALAAGLEHLRALGREFPVVLLPLCNPLGYATDWRYLDRRRWEEGSPGASVGDAEHVLPDSARPERARNHRASSPEAAALVAHVLALAQTYPPALVVDLHEDELLDEGYIYSQGRDGAGTARKLAGVLRAAGVPVKTAGGTRFGEEIVEGVVGPQSDGSLDELLAAEKLVVHGRPAPGPSAPRVFVVETPAAALPLETRRNAHLAVLAALGGIAKEFLP